MTWLWVLAVLGGVGSGHGSETDQGQYTEAEGRRFMEKLNRESASWASRAVNAMWDYESNLTDANLQKQLEVSSENAKFFKEKWQEVIKYPWEDFEDSGLKRQFKFYSKLGTAALPDEKRSRLEEVIAKMSDIYSTTKLVEWQDSRRKEKKSKEPTMSLEPDLVEFFSDHANESCKLQYYWEGWYRSVGQSVKPLFEEYVNLTNEAAILNNYTDNAAAWNSDFEMDNFEDAVHQLYLQILPFYKQLHAYVRRRLAEVHNTKHHQLIYRDGCLPAHILGNVWAQEWQNVYQYTVPFPGKVSLDVTPTMKAKNFTPKTMFELAEEFYTSINLKKMTETFWKKSIIEKPTDRDMVCHASAWDFYAKDDFRIKMCTKITLEDLKTIHHETGHIQYFMQYEDQPYIFRGGANSGFHEALGDTVALSFSTANHLIKIGLLDPETYEEDEQTEKNSLLQMALEKIAFLPYAYVLDLWRWEIFRGKTSPADYNCRFWQLRKDLQGIIPPSDRSANDFDGGGKFHVVSDTPYIRYFVSFIIQFQFHKALCIKAGQYNPEDPASKPLHHCDIYQSKEAGDLFGKMMKMGASKHWQDAMEVLTGQRNMDAGPLLEYFKPLHDWLVSENQRTGETIGWSSDSEKYHSITCFNSGEVKLMPIAQVKNCKCHYVFPGEKT